MNQLMHLCIYSRIISSKLFPAYITFLANAQKHFGPVSDNWLSFMESHITDTLHWKKIETLCVVVINMENIN